MELPIHGANASKLYEIMGITMPKNVLDLSENVNSLGVTDTIIHAWPSLVHKITCYPDEQAEPFRSKVAFSHNVLAKQVLVTNGAAEGLMVLAQYFAGQNILILEPTFSEYKRTLKLQNCHIESIVASEITNYQLDMIELHKKLQTVKGCYICNPNNPTGVLLERSCLEILIADNPKCMFVIDEAFMDWTDEAESVIPIIKDYSNIIVVRSMTKMFAMAGVRLGYLLGQRVANLREYLPQWNVSQLAIELGLICLEEQKFVAKSRLHSEKILKDMKAYFQSIGCRITNSKANYLLFQLPQNYSSDNFFKYLLHKGIVLRHTKNYEGLNGNWFRIAVKTKENWQQARKEIEQYVKNHSLLSS